MPSISGPMEGLPAREENLFFLMNMWKIWPSSTIPCHPMWPSTPHCMTRTPWKRALGWLMVNGTMPSCAGSGYARASPRFADLLVHYNICNVVPLLTALQKQCDIYKEVTLEMLKDCPSLPSIGMRYGMRGSKGLFHTFGQEQADLAELMKAPIIDFPSCSSNTWRSASPPSGHLTMLLSCFPVVPWSALMQICCNHGPWCRTCPSGLAMSGVRRTMAWMLRSCIMTMDHGTAGPPFNGWPMRQKSAGWRACCMQATGLSCDGTCATNPWMAIIQTLPRCSSSMAACFTVTTVARPRTPGSALLLGRGRSAMKRMKTTWGTPVATHSWPSGSARGSPSSWPQCSSGRRWVGTVSGSIPESLMPSSRLAAPGADTQVLLQVIHEDCVFGLVQVDTHTPEGLKNQFHDYHPSSSLSHCPRRMQSKQGTVQQESATSAPPAAIVVAATVMAPTRTWSTPSWSALPTS